MMDPWGLTERQARTMDLMIEHDLAKVVAREMGHTPKQVEGVVRDVKKKMGLNYPGIRHRHLVLWDRFRCSRRP